MSQCSEPGISCGGSLIRNNVMGNTENIVRPRLNDYHGILMLQDKVDFAIPFLDEDIPLYVDPFLLWKSPSQMDNGLHDSIIQSFNHLGYLVNKGKCRDAVDLLISLSECDAVGLGTSKTRKGSRIGDKVANDILSLFENIPQLKTAGFSHIEEIQLLVGQVAKDRISDIACNLISSFLIDYTIQRCEENKIPMEQVTMESLYDTKLHKLKTESVYMKDNKTIDQIRTLKYEFQALSSKKPNDVLNEFKVKYVNKSLKAANELLGEDKPYEDFESFSDEDLPTNSDVLMMLNLYLNGMSRYKDANSTEHSSPIDWSSEFKTKTWDVED